MKQGYAQRYLYPVEGLYMSVHYKRPILTITNVHAGKLWRKMRLIACLLGTGLKNIKRLRRDEYSK